MGGLTPQKKKMKRSGCVTLGAQTLIALLFL